MSSPAAFFSAENAFADVEIPEVDEPIAPASVKMSPGDVKIPKIKISGKDIKMNPSRYTALGLDWSVTSLVYDPVTNQKSGLFQVRTMKTRSNPKKHNATILYCDKAITVIDIDDLTKPESFAIKQMCEASDCNAIQQTRKGFHYVFKAKPDIYTNTYPKYGFDIRGAAKTTKDGKELNGGVIYCEPTTYTTPECIVSYKWLKFPDADTGFVEMPQELYDFLVSLGCSSEAPKPVTNEIILPTHPPTPTSSVMYEDTEYDDDLDSVLLGSQPSVPPPRKLVGLEEVNRLASMLTAEWLSSTTNWFKFAYCLKGLYDTGESEELFIHHSARAPKYDTPHHIANNRKIWKSLKPKGAISIGSLKHWAKKCSPERYFAEAKDTYWSLIRLGTQPAFCELFYNEMAGDIIYSQSHKCFYFYDPAKGLWRECENDAYINFQFVETTTAVIRRMIGELPPASDESAQSNRDKDNKLLLKAQNACDIRAKQMVKDFLPALCRPDIDPVTYFNKDPDLLPLANGVWNFREKRLVPYEREHYFTFRIPVAYNPKADTSGIERAVRDWFNGDQAVIEFVQYYMGYCLTGYTTRQDFLIAWGNAAGNGKSLLWGEIMKRLLGDPRDTKNSFWGEITTHAISTNAGENNDQLYSIDGKRFICLSEPQEGVKTKIDTALLKKLTGDSTHTCSAKYKNAKTFNIVGKFQISCNDIPEMKLDTPAMKRRCLVVEQNVAFRDGEDYDEADEADKAAGRIKRKDEAFIKGLLDAPEGILLFALQGANAYIDDPRRDPPPAMMNAKAKAQTNADTLGTWLKGNIRNFKAMPLADRPADWERKKVTLKALKDKWKSEDKFPESRRTGFNTTFLEKAKALGFEAEAGRPGKSEERLMWCEFIEDEEDEE